MTELASPWWLLLLPLVALVPFQRRLTGRLALAVPTTTGVRPGRSWRTWLVWVPPALRTLGLALVVFALARPRVAHQSVSVESEGLDILLAVDTSGSMQAEDMVIGLDSVSRLEAAKAVMAEFVEHRPHDRIGVVVFGEEAWTQVPLTLDHETLAALIGQIELGNAGAGGTAVGTAIAVSAKRMKDLDAPSKIVILLTDGRSNAGQIGPLEAAEAAGVLGIKVYTIGVGGKAGGVLGMMLGDGVDVDGLTAVAKATGAKFFRATDVKSLQDVYAAIDELEPSTAEVLTTVRHVERFRWFLGPALLLLALDAVLSLTLLRRGP